MRQVSAGLAVFALTTGSALASDASLDRAAAEGGNQASCKMECCKMECCKTQHEHERTQASPAEFTGFE